MDLKATGEEIQVSVKQAKVRSEVPFAALVEQMAEEASELAHALLKYARAIRRENPTPVTLDEARANVVEEYTDLLLVGDILCLKGSAMGYEEKLDRWIDRNSDLQSG